MTPDYKADRIRLDTLLDQRNSGRGIKPRRAVMSVNFDKHTVIDMFTGERHEGLAPEKAWELLERLNAA